MTWTTIDNQDYIILYASPGQTGETVFNFVSTPTVDLSNAPGVISKISGNHLTLNYMLQGFGVTTITVGTNKVHVVIMDKTTALQWHASDIAGKGDFGAHFSIGTNQRYVCTPDSK